MPLDTVTDRLSNYPETRSKTFWEQVIAYQTARADQQAADAAAKAAKERSTAALDAIRAAIGEAPALRFGRNLVSIETTGGSLGKLITAAMVGTYVGGRAPYSRLKIEAC